MAQINQWNGGLNTRVDSSMIAVNEGVTYLNVDNSRVTLSPVKADTLVLSSVKDYCYKFEGTLIQSDNYRNYVEFQEKIYYSDSIGRPQKSNDGITWYNLGITKPSNTLTIATSGSSTMSGTYQYCYTYFNDNDGTESQPNTFSSELLVSSQGVQVSGITASTDAQVTNIKLYRLGGSLTEMSLVVTLSNTTQSYLDALGDDVIDGTVLTSYSYAPALTALKYLTEYNVMFFGAIGDKLYFSDVAFVNYWSELNFIDFDAPITGIGSTPNGLLVFTKYKVYVVVGTDPTTLAKYFLNGNQGCVEHKTIKFTINTLSWVSPDGVCMSDGNAIQVVTRDKLGRLEYSSIKDCSVFDDVYYLVLNDRTLCLDNRYVPCFRELDITPTSMFVYEDVLYYVQSGNLYSLGTSSSNKTFTFESGKLSDFNVTSGVSTSLTSIKNYKDIYIWASGDITITFYIDGSSVGSFVLVEGFNDIKLPQNKRTGYYMSYSVTGTGTINEIEYKLEGRQNGR